MGKRRRSQPMNWKQSRAFTPGVVHESSSPRGSQIMKLPRVVSLGPLFWQFILLLKAEVRISEHEPTSHLIVRYFVLFLGIFYPHFTVLPFYSDDNWHVSPQSNITWHFLQVNTRKHLCFFFFAKRLCFLGPLPPSKQFVTDFSVLSLPRSQIESKFIELNRIYNNLDYLSNFMSNYIYWIQIL